MNAMESTMYGTTEDWRAARAALVDELTRLRRQFDCGGPLGRSETRDPAEAPALVPGQGFHRSARRPTMLGLCT
jgi:hypothetical protein